MENSGQLLPDEEARNKHARGWWVVGIGCLVVVLLGILIPRGDPAANQAASTNQAAGTLKNDSARSTHDRMTSHHSHGGTAATAEEIVATKLSQFARNRREVFRAMAK